MEATNELNAALAKAQSEMGAVTLNKTNPHFSSKFADLASVRSATLPALNANGLSITQTTQIDDGNLVMVTTLRHVSGAEIVSHYPLPIDKPQVMGSARTYARRYEWSSICGVCGEDDDDGNAAQEGKAPAARNGETFGGPLTKTELKKQMRAFAGDLALCEDSGQLEGLLEGSKALCDQCARDLPDWWLGGGDIAGAAASIEQKRKRIEAIEADQPRAA
jgi:hypothetical protein